MQTWPCPSPILPAKEGLFEGLLIATGEAIPLRGLEGVPGLPDTPQDEAGLNGGGNVNPLQYSYLGNPMDRGVQPAQPKGPRPGEGRGFTSDGGLVIFYLFP